MLQALNNCGLFHTARTATSGSVQQDIGFSKANVKARSDINDSTKKVTNATKGYIGEKAVGFKSVFNVANAAWISTGYYTFRFARDSVLSMIVPIWCDINAAPTVSERTRFCRQIMKIQDRKIVKADLLRLQMEPLLFIRKLRNINVCIYDVGSVKVTAGFALKRRQLPDPQPQTTNTYVLNGKFREAKFPGRQGTMPGASYEANLCDFRRTRHSTT